MKEWRAVEYEGKVYPEVKAICGEDHQASVKVPVGKDWKFPCHPDEIYYHRNQRVRNPKPSFSVNNQ